VPRRRRPATAIAEVILNAAELTALRETISVIVDREPQFGNISAEIRAALTDRLLNAVCYGRAGLREILSRRGAKPDAWAADILVRDVCDALRDAGFHPVMAPKRSLSVAQDLAGQIGCMGNLPMKGELYEQMQRARKIDRRQLTFVLGRWQDLN
jgi:hypothetical protein